MKNLSQILKELSKLFSIGKLEKTLIFIFIFAVLFPFPNGGNQFFWKYFFDAGHPILFFLSTFFLYKIYKPKKLTIVILISLIAASTLEGIQPIFGRSAGLKDLILSCAGVITAGLCLSKSSFYKVLGLVSFTIIQLTAFIPVTKAVKAMSWRKTNFPLIANFENEIELRLFRGGLKRKEKEQNHYLEISSNNKDDYWAKYYAGDKDWSKFNQFYFEIYSPINSKISIRIDDNGDCTEYEDRFNKKFKLKKGWNKISLSIDEIKKSVEDFNLNKIRFIYFFKSEKQKNDLSDSLTWVGLDNLKLKNQ